jgi:hypothetical protein
VHLVGFIIRMNTHLPYTGAMWCGVTLLDFSAKHFLLKTDLDLGVHKSWVNIFSLVVLNIYGLSLWNLLHVTHTAPRILMWLLDCKICASLPGSTEVFCTFCFPSSQSQNLVSARKIGSSLLLWSHIKVVNLLLFAGVTTWKKGHTWRH